MDESLLFAFLAALAVIALIALLGRRRHSVPWHFKGKVVYVCDGDTVWVRTWYGRRVKLRLLGIDAPESQQAFGKDSQKMLERLIGGKTAEVSVVAVDRYGRYVAGLVCGGTDVCLKMVELGAAWPYYAYLRTLTPEAEYAYRQAGEKARRERLGLWKDGVAEAPWAWRKRHSSLWMRFLLWLRRLLGF